MTTLCTKDCHMANFCQKNSETLPSISHDDVFYVLYDYYKNPIYKFFYEKTFKDKTTAEDLTQESFMKAYRNLDRIQEFCNITGWIYTIANNTLIDHQRKLQRRKPFSSSFDVYNEDIPSNEQTPFQNLLQNEIKNNFDCIFKSMPDHYCRAIKLQEHHNLSYAEAAKLMDLSLTAYTSLLKRARTKMRELFIAHLLGMDKDDLTKKEYALFSKWLSENHEDISEPIEKTMLEFFNEKASFYNTDYYYEYHGFIDDFILHKYPLAKNHIVADYGMGTGIFTSKLSRLVKRVDGFDNSKEMCDVARENFKKHNINNIVCKNLDFTTLASSQQYDYAYCITVLHHLTYPHKAVQKMAESLKEGGALIISDFQKHNCTELVEKNCDLWYGFTKEQFIKFLTEAGLKNVWVKVLQNSRFSFVTKSGKTVKNPTIIGGGEK